MSRALLHAALEARARHVSPFLVLGDPTPEISLELATAAVREGASMLELGFPYGDPCADGPAIQAADVRALAGGTSTTKAFEILARIRGACPRTPLNLLVYGNLVHARGYSRFCEEAAAAGASSLLVPDIALEESATLVEASSRAGLGHVELVGPLTTRARLARIAESADAFLYLVAHQGVTGARDGFSGVQDLIKRTLKAKRPVSVGFGLSRPEHLEAAFSAGARIAVVGSHLAEVIGNAWSTDRSRVVEAFASAIGPLASTGRAH